MATETEVCNLALGKLGGAGDALSGNAFISDINGTDKVSAWCKLNFPRVRRRGIIDLATRGCPFRQSIRFLDCGAQIADDDTPEIGAYLYAFNLPGDCLAVVMQFAESFIAIRRAAKGSQSNTSPIEYKWDVVASKDGTKKIFLTDVLSNCANDSAFIEYAIDTPNTGGWTEEMIDCVATLLASEVAPVIGKDMATSDAMLVKYREVTIPNAQRANQFGFNSSIRRIPDLSGGRSSGITPRTSRDLGTYLTADGTRKAIF